MVKISQLKRTPIYPEYDKWDAKTVNFGGWDLPVSFSGIIKEHHAAREKAALFDVSHMGEIIVEGQDSLNYLQKMTTNDVANLQPGKVQYSFMCKEDGGTVDDFLVYMLDELTYMLVVNAANIDTDLHWLQANINEEEVSIHNQTNVCALLAVQGPYAADIVQKMTDVDVQELKPFHFREKVTFQHIEHPALVSRTGYTGEDGFEIYVHRDSAATLWREILEKGEDEGLLPAGLGARDTLRFEAGLPLYGQELSESISPIEANLTFAVKLDKETEFIGKETLKNQLVSGTERKLIGLEVLDKGIARTNHEVFNREGKKIGIVTTGTKSPTLNKAIAFALLESNYNEEGEKVIIQVRKKQLEALSVHTPFYKR